MAELRSSATPPRILPGSINHGSLWTVPGPEGEATGSSTDGPTDAAQNLDRPEDADVDMEPIEPVQHSDREMSAIDPALRVPDALAALRERTSHPRNQLQFLDPVASMFQLKGDAKVALRRFIEARNVEREVMAFGAMMSIKQLIESNTVVANELWTIPERVEAEIDKYAIRILFSPQIAAYDQGPLDQLALIIKRKRWGLSATVDEDEDGKWDKLLHYARGRLTQRKSEMKKAIAASYDRKEVLATEDDSPLSSGHDIVKLCKSLLKIGTKKIPSGTNINVTPQFCTRIAFLRSVHFEHGSVETYWKHADDELMKVRKDLDYEDDALSYFMTQVLKRDRQLFPCKNWEHVDRIKASVSQTEIDQVLQTGRAENMQAEG
ncbi:uncharacterized protein B0H18DRAFT_1120686 [Fomitopsis serialis]|nr:uncharacterized protein B0H18DRAFT_1120686 [Neoantrodia serialis]KAH9922978.1 hypothetical protein B0H18DRAFT_1120686 [Neoantrodia serialis]